jgi:hypothetical protein
MSSRLFGHFVSPSTEMLGLCTRKTRASELFMSKDHPRRGGSRATRGKISGIPEGLSCYVFIAVCALCTTVAASRMIRPGGLHASRWPRVEYLCLKLYNYVFFRLFFISLDTLLICF